jgi:hypothetical protein
MHHALPVFNLPLPSPIPLILYEALTINTLNDQAGLVYVNVLPVVIVDVTGIAASGVEGVFDVVSDPESTTAVPDEETVLYGTVNSSSLDEEATLAIFFEESRSVSRK